MKYIAKYLDFTRYYHWKLIFSAALSWNIKSLYWKKESFQINHLNLFLNKLEKEQESTKSQQEKGNNKGKRGKKENQNSLTPTWNGEEKDNT